MAIDTRPTSQDSLVNEALRARLYEVASRSSIFTQFAPEAPEPMTRWARWYWTGKSVWRRWKPVFHFGDCNHDDCD